MQARCSTMPPMTCTGYGLSPSTRQSASRQTAKRLGQDIVERRAVFELFLQLGRFGCSSASVSFCMAGSSASTFSAIGRMRLSSLVGKCSEQLLHKRHIVNPCFLPSGRRMYLVRVLYIHLIIIHPRRGPCQTCAGAKRYFLLCLRLPQDTGRRFRQTGVYRRAGGFQRSLALVGPLHKSTQRTPSACATSASCTESPIITQRSGAKPLCCR